MVTTPQIHVEPKAQVALREVFPPSSSPSTCSPMSTRPDVDYDFEIAEEDDLARENATIDRLLLEANADLVSFAFNYQSRAGSVRRNESPEMFKTKAPKYWGDPAWWI